MPELPRPDAIRALRSRYEALGAVVQAELDGLSRDGSQAVHEARMRGLERRRHRLIDTIEACAAAVEAESPEAPRLLERLDVAIRAFEPDAAVLRGGRLEPLPALPWEAHEPSGRRPHLRVIR
ncbi:MAG: hypothetical protein AMXMBFR64_30640 [Myxococcales bacterium]